MFLLCQLLDGPETERAGQTGESCREVHRLCWSQNVGQNSGSSSQTADCFHSAVTNDSTQNQRLSQGLLQEGLRQNSPVFVTGAQLGEASTRTSALLHPLHHLPLQSQAALGLRVRQRGHALGLASRQLGLLNAARRDATMTNPPVLTPVSYHSAGNVRLYLLQQLNFGLQDFLHVADLLLPLRQATLQLRFILIGQALGR